MCGAGKSEQCGGASQLRLSGSDSELRHASVGLWSIVSVRDADCAPPIVSVLVGRQSTTSAQWRAGHSFRRKWASRAPNQFCVAASQLAVVADSRTVLSAIYRYVCGETASLFHIYCCASGALLLLPLLPAALPAVCCFAAS